MSNPGIQSAIEQLSEAAENLRSECGENKTIIIITPPVQTNEGAADQPKLLTKKEAFLAGHFFNLGSFSPGAFRYNNDHEEFVTLSIDLLNRGKELEHYCWIKEITENYLHIYFRLFSKFEVEKSIPFDSMCFLKGYVGNRFSRAKSELVEKSDAELSEIAAREKRRFSRSAEPYVSNEADLQNGRNSQ